MFSLALGTPTTFFEGEFRFLADAEGLGTSVDRNPSVDLLPIFNDSHRSLREYVTGLGYTQFITRALTGSLPTSPTVAGDTYGTISLGVAGTPGTLPDFSQIKMVRVLDTSGRWRTLPECTLLQLGDYASDATRGDPEAWCLLNLGSVSSSPVTYTAGELAITPVPRGGSYAIWTMKDEALPVATTDVYYYNTVDWKKWHMYHAMAQICGTRDKDTARKLQSILRQLDPEEPGTPAYNIHRAAPTASGSRTWTRSSNYRTGRQRGR